MAKKRKRMEKTKSIIQKNTDICYLCGKPGNWEDGMLEEHHVFNGTANRKKSEQYGLKVMLHGLKCHREGKMSVHRCRGTDLALKIIGQRAFEKEIGSRERFMAEFGRNYITEDEE